MTMQTTLVRVTTPMPDREPLIWHFKALTTDQQEALRWVRSSGEVLPEATVEVVSALLARPPGEGG
jgi:hypothetical protein